MRCLDLSHPFPPGSLIWKNYCNYRYNKQGSNPCLAANEKRSAKDLYNVNKKLKLYYGEKTEGLKIESEHRKGSTISFIIPVVVAEEVNV